jgi:hypothetical protein
MLNALGSVYRVATTFNGTSDASLCEAHGEDCSKCNAGYYLTDDLGQLAAGHTHAGTGKQQCKGFAGECENGDLIGQSNRTEENHCGSCLRGFHLENKKCKQNLCDCEHGKGSGSTSTNVVRTCESHNSEDCAECDDGYVFDTTGNTRKCVSTVCTCKGGTPTTYDARSHQQSHKCSKDGDDCSSCNNGYTLNSIATTGRQICVDKQSTCSGEGTIAGEGTCVIAKGYSGQISWDSANASWVIRVEANLCTCSNGVPTTFNGTSDATLCEAHGEDCSKCNAGYYLTDDLGQLAAGHTNAGTGKQQCKGFAGECENGLLVIQSLRHVENQCGKCFPGYHYENLKCWSNTGSTNLESEVVSLQESLNNAPNLATDTNVATIVSAIVIVVLLIVLIILVASNSKKIKMLSDGGVTTSEHGMNFKPERKTLPQTSVELVPITEKPPVVENPLVLEMVDKEQTDPTKNDEDPLGNV